MAKLTQQATIALIKAMGLSCRRTQHGEYRVNVPRGAETTAYYTYDAQDAIATAREMAKSVQSPRTWINDFKKHLASGKFQGTEVICLACGCATEEWTCVGIGFPVSKCCHEKIRADRKDLISTADVLRWLSTLEGLL